MKVAIDIGYGHTKVMTDKKEFKIPSAVALSKVQMVSNDDDVSFEGKKYLVGEDGLRGAVPTRDYTFIYKFAPLIIYNVFKECDMLDKLNTATINTGLSLYDIEKAPEFDKTCANRKEEFIKRISKFVINDEVFEPTINLFAQGQGVWQDYCTANGFLENGYEIVLDIGYRTNDIIIFKNGSASKSESNADDKGVNVIVTELRKILNKKFDITLTEQEVSEILKNKTIDIYGIEKDLSPYIEDIVDSYIDTMFGFLKAEYGNILKSAKRVIIAGGGAYILLPYREQFPLNVVFANDGFEFSNVRGYYNA